MSLYTSWYIYSRISYYRSDVNDERIYKAPIDEGQAKAVVVHGDVVNADGLAVDWYYNLTMNYDPAGSRSKEKVYSFLLQDLPSPVLDRFDQGYNWSVRSGWRFQENAALRSTSGAAIYRSGSYRRVCEITLLFFFSFLYINPCCCRRQYVHQKSNSKVPPRDIYLSLV